MICASRIDEKRGLEEVLLEHVKLREGQAAKHHKLREYSAAGLGGADGGLQVFLKQERCPVCNLILQDMHALPIGLHR